jgi:general stress protein 26
MAQTDEAVVKLNELIKGVDFTMLTTVRTDGSLHSCPMAAKEVDGDGLLWFISSDDTEKVEAIRTNPHVNLAYSDGSRQRYISITGRCELVRDHVKAAELWKPLYKTWFPKGLEDPNLILLKVHVQIAEYWHAPENRMVQVPGFTKD